MVQQIVLFGGGGHAKVVLDAIIMCRPEAHVVILDDDPEAVSRPMLNKRVEGGRDRLDMLPDASVVPAIGRNALRAELVGWLNCNHRRLETIVHPRAILSTSVIIGGGSFVAAGVIVNADSRIGKAVIINTGASIDHDCIIGSFAHVAPGARLCGGVTVGEQALVGTGAVILPGIEIGSHSVIGAGSVVTSNVRSGETVVGTPARRV